MSSKHDVICCSESLFAAEYCAFTTKFVSRITVDHWFHTVVLQNIGFIEIVQYIENRKEVNDVIQLQMGVISDYT